MTSHEHHVAFLHTAPAHVEVFEDLLGRLAPTLKQRHDVDESLLGEARKDASISPGLRERIHAAMHTAASSGARIVVCTCSTVGGVAESAGEGRDFQSMRIDRPMAEKAVRYGPNVLVAAALNSTLEPTCNLLRDCARRARVQIKPSEKLCPEAWALFVSGDLDAYHKRIADELHHGAQGADVVVLAQASMAGAVAHCKQLTTPVLSSPRLGVEGALQRYHALAGRDAI